MCILLSLLTLFTKASFAIGKDFLDIDWSWLIVALPQSHAGVEQLKFAFYDPNWAKGQEAIKTLDVRYKDLWNIDFEYVRTYLVYLLGYLFSIVSVLLL